jgi:DNA gyrase subunit A
MAIDAERRDWHARSRHEILAAVLAAGQHRAEVLNIVAASATADAARLALSDVLGVSEVAATAVLDMQVRRFAVQELDRVFEEFEEIDRELDDPSRSRDA